MANGKSRKEVEISSVDSDGAVLKIPGGGLVYLDRDDVINIMDKINDATNKELMALRKVK